MRVELPYMYYQLPNEVKIILEKFQKEGYQIYIVGGAVRDLIMGREINDWDFTTDATPEEILKLFPEGFYDNKFGTVGISIGDGVFEITTMRKEGDYKDFRHPDKVGWTNKIEEDLARRDFTINAMAAIVDILPARPAGGPVGRQVGQLTDKKVKLDLIDPFEGKDDLVTKTIKAVGDPQKRFSEDALRLMRAIRIATELEFNIEKQTFEAIKQNATLIQQVAWERIRDELFKILASANPYTGIVKLREAGIFQKILPEIEKCFGIIQKGPKHDRVYDIGDHSLLTLKYTPSDDPIVKLAALLHDVGKPDTVNVDKEGNVTFYNHDIVGGKITIKIVQRFNLSKKQSDKLYKLVRWHLFTVDEKQTDSAIRRFIKNIGIENIEDMMALRIGDRLGGGTQKAVSWRMKKFRERIDQVLHKPFSITDLKINGNDVMKELNIKPGPKVGEVLQKLFEEVLENPDKNNREYLLQRTKQL